MSLGGLRSRAANLVRETPLARPARVLAEAVADVAARPRAARARPRRSGAAVIMYHGVAPAWRDPLVEGAHVPATLFRREIRHLKRHYRIVPLAELVDRLRSGRPVPDDWAVLTFDDGYRNNLECAWQILREEGRLPMSVFAVSEFVGTRTTFWTSLVLMATIHGRGRVLRIPGPGGFSERPARSRRQRANLYWQMLPYLKSLTHAEREEVLKDYYAQFGAGEVEEIRAGFPSFDWLSWDELRELRADGADVGSHTRTHVYLREDLSPERMRDEVVGSREAFRKHMGHAPEHFAYPNGSAADFCPRSRALLEEAGYHCGVTTVRGTARTGADPFEIRRVPWCVNRMSTFRLVNARGA